MHIKYQHSPGDWGVAVRPPVMCIKIPVRPECDVMVMELECEDIFKSKKKSKINTNY